MKAATQTLTAVVRIVLAVVTLLLTIALVIELYPPPANPTEIVNGASLPNKTLPVTSNMTDMIFPPLSAYSRILERPLFNESRRPPETVPNDTQRKEIAAPPPAPPDYTVKAIVITPDIKIAILQQGNTNTVQHVVPSDVLSGWTVTEILAHSVTLTQGKQRVTIELAVKPASQKTGLAAPSPQNTKSSTSPAAARDEESQPSSKNHETGNDSPSAK